jgi:hypothetical protein
MPLNDNKNKQNIPLLEQFLISISKSLKERGKIDNLNIQIYNNSLPRFGTGTSITNGSNELDNLG